MEKETLVASMQATKAKFAVLHHIHSVRIFPDFLLKLEFIDHLSDIRTFVFC